MKTNVLRFAALAVMCVLTTGVWAQDVQTAVLQHGDEMKAFYGADGLSKALDHAVQGDLISLSAGTFTTHSVNAVKHAVRIQGAGYVQDVANNRYATLIVGDLDVRIPKSEENLTIEGVRFDGNLLANGADEQLGFGSGFILKKCFVGGNVSLKGHATNSLIEHCRIKFLDVEGSSTSITNGVFIRNTIIAGLDANGYVDGLVVENSVIGDFREANGTFRNCITYKGYGQSASSFYNCIHSNAYPYSGTVESDYRVNDINQIFESLKLPDDGIDINSTFQLTDAAKASYKGSDGTEIGIYGGSAPFTDIPSIPQITSKAIARESDSSGKLSVKITVEAQK